MFKTVLLTIVAIILVILTWSYVRDKEWENLSLLGIKTAIFLIALYVAEHY